MSMSKPNCLSENSHHEPSLNDLMFGEKSQPCMAPHVQYTQAFKWRQPHCLKNWNMAHEHSQPHKKTNERQKRRRRKIKKNEEKCTRRPGDGIRWNNYSLLYDELMPIYFNIVRIIAYGWWWMDIKTDRCVAKAYKIQPSAGIYTYKIPKNILVNIGAYSKLFEFHDMR